MRKSSLKKGKGLKKGEGLKKDKKHYLKCRSTLKSKSGKVTTSASKMKQSIINEYRYKELRALYLSDYPICEKCESSKATQIHHKAKQKGYNKFRFFMAICNECHTWIHDNSKLSYELGYLIDVDPKDDSIELGKYHEKFGE